MPTDPALAARSRYANACRNGATPEQIVAARQDLAAAMLARAIAQALATATALRPEQRDKLALMLLRGDGVV